MCLVGIIFVVDSCDFERFEEARLELAKISKNHETLGVPILIIANKQDLPGARTSAEIERTLCLQELTATHPWTLVPTIALIGEGLYESLDSLYGLMLSAKKAAKAKQKQQMKKR